MGFGDSVMYVAQSTLVTGEIFSRGMEMTERR